jgi:hypothetical protein
LISAAFNLDRTAKWGTSVSICNGY